ncbi:MAG: phosphatase PAP2 family protein [Hydrogenophaga sp.]
MKNATFDPAQSAWGYRQIDVRLFRWMRAGHGARPRLLPVACAIAHRSWAPMLFTLLAMASTLPSGGWTLLQVLGMAVIAQVMSKQCAAFWAAPRPFAIGLSHNHLKHGPRAGLPSTHAAVMGSVVGFMAVAAPGHPLLAVLGSMALATAWARVYAGAHFPSDVLLGLGLGGTVGWVGARLFGLG